MEEKLIFDPKSQLLITLGNVETDKEGRVDIESYVYTLLKKYSI